MSFECVQNGTSKRRFGRPAVAQREVTAFIFLVLLFFLPVAQRFLQRRFDLRIRPQRLGMFPFHNRLIQLVQPVVCPARQL